jgi:hypothetical protein
MSLSALLSILCLPNSTQLIACWPLSKGVFSGVEKTSRSNVPHAYGMRKLLDKGKTWTDSDTFKEISSPDQAAIL